MLSQYIIRKAFDIVPDDAVKVCLHKLTRSEQLSHRDEYIYLKPYLPASILWRQKEQFSDGVGYSWIDG